MNQCKDCAMWTRGKIPSWPPDLGECRRRDVHPRWQPVVWSDNGACPAFEARKDWADELAAKLLGRQGPAWLKAEQEAMANEIRAAAKAEGLVKP